MWMGADPGQRSRCGAGSPALGRLVCVPRQRAAQDRRATLDASILHRSWIGRMAAGHALRAPGAARTVYVFLITGPHTVAAWSATRKGAAMGSYSVKRIDEMEAIFHGSFRRAGAELGLESFGLQVFDLPAGAENYPEHDHSHDGQEEVYVVLRGSGEWDIDGERVPVDSERVLRIAAGTKRRLWPGSEGIRVLALG